MNKTLAVLIVGVAALGTAACSSTRTQRAPGEQVDDAALLTSVKSALAAESAEAAADVNVDVYRGEVKLSGFVDNENDRAQAVAAARVHVRNHPVGVLSAAGGGEGGQVAVARNDEIADLEQPGQLAGGERGRRHAARTSRSILSAARLDSAMIVNDGLIPGALGKTLESAA